MDRLDDIINANNNETNNVLIVEDDDSFYSILKVMLRGSGLEDTVVERARNLSEIDSVIERGLNRFKMLIFDGNLIDHSPFSENTVQKIREIRSDLGFKGIMVAASGDSNMQARQIESGCDFSISKHEIPNIIRDINIHFNSRTHGILEMSA